MHGLHALGGAIARLERLGATVIVGDRISALREQNDRRTVFVAMEADVATRLDFELAQSQLPTLHRLDLRAKVDHHGLGCGVTLIAFRSVFSFPNRRP
jgi:hypothetical protein